MKLFLVLPALLLVASASIYPEGEDKEAWDARINAKIDALHKRDVSLVVEVPEELRGQKLGLKVRQTKTPIPFGTAMVASRISSCWTNAADDAYCNFARENFNYAVMENAMKWRSMEYTYDQYDTYNIEQTISWLQFHNKGLRAHCIFWDVDNPTNFPDWVYELYGQDMVDAIHHRIDHALPLFQGRVDHWDVNNEMLHGNFFADRTGDPDIRVKIFQWANEKDPNTLKFVNDYNVLLYEPDDYIAQIQDLLNRGAPVSGVGFQAHLGPDPIDLGKAEDSLNRIYSQFRLPMWITEFDWQNNDNDHAQHAIELDNFYRMLLSVEGLGGIVMWGFWDQAHWRPSAAIATGDDCHANEAGIAYQNIYNNVIRTNLELSPVDGGKMEEMQFDFRGFKGTYDIELIDELGNTVKVLTDNFEIEDNMHARLA